MNLKIKKGTYSPQAIQLPYSKSISNRLLIMQALADFAFDIENLSQADDTRILKEVLSSESDKIDIGMAGTAFRFLTAYYAVKQQEVELTGHSRMLKRPIGDLVEALIDLGAKINFVEQEGFPPIQIHKAELRGEHISLKVDKSSQYLTALLLVAPYLPNGLSLTLQGDLVSRPYAEMTCKLMQQLGVKLNWKENLIQVEAGHYLSNEPVRVESDWSSAAFFYQYFACSKLESLEILGLNQNSIQGDSICAQLFEQLGVNTSYIERGVVLSRKDIPISSIEIDLTDSPDLIPSFAIAAALLLKEVKISGVQTLRIKESNRVEALKLELAKIGVELSDIDSSEIYLQIKGQLPKSVRFQVYNDHRMAMSFAMLAAYIDEVLIEDTEVVSKSFPNFWQETKKLGFTQSAF